MAPSCYETRRAVKALSVPDCDMLRCHKESVLVLSFCNDVLFYFFAKRCPRSNSPCNLDLCTRFMAQLMPHGCLRRLNAIGYKNDMNMQFQWICTVTLDALIRMFLALDCILDFESMFCLLPNLASRCSGTSHTKNIAARKLHFSLPNLVSFSMKISMLLHLRFYVATLLPHRAGPLLSCF
jgi:hypothetical protein